MSTQLRQLTPPTICALIAAIGGLLGGATAVHGLRQNQYGPTGSPVLANHGANTMSDAGTTSDTDPASSASRCEGCSERDLGYRWATLARVHSPDDCPNDSWGFRRGCLDYTGGV